MPKINVYLPDELYEETRAATDLNLSSVCQRAIRKELDQMNETAKITGDLEEVVARLRGTMRDEDAGKHTEGREDGARWAREYASFGELREIDSFELGVGGSLSEHSIVEFVGDKHQEAMLISVHMENDAYWRGFLAAAVEVADAVLPLLGD